MTDYPSLSGLLVMDTILLRLWDLVSEISLSSLSLLACSGVSS